MPTQCARLLVTVDVLSIDLIMLEGNPTNQTLIENNSVIITSPHCCTSLQGFVFRSG